jgi:predicted Ser/Thr protein kinase
MSGIEEIYEETASYPLYEGSIGASTREMRGVLFDAAQDPRYGYLSPFSVLARLGELSKRTSEYGWLEQETQPGGYHDTAHFLVTLRERLLGFVEEELDRASGLVDEARHAELFERYIEHVSHWVKGEKVQNPHTGALEDPDETLMRDIEKRLGITAEPEAARHSTIGRIAAWAIEHPGAKVSHAEVFGAELGKLRKAAFAERRVGIARMCRDLVIVVREEGKGLESARSAAAQRMLDTLVTQSGYEPTSAADAASELLRSRYAELLA